MEQPLFILDVGTRKVAGLLVARQGGEAVIQAWSLHEHPERAMLDGQVHDITKAAAVVGRVKADLEKAAGVSLSRAHVAVAGRSLITQAGLAAADLDPRQPLAPARVLALELEAVREARLALRDGRLAAGLHCVGYSLVRGRLDGAALASLAGHQGSRAEVEVLATFLPKGVLDALSAALKICGLGLASLTLEPIAALSLAVPGDLKRLNLALVDVGAGTSDIALTRQGSVTAFAMVPLAGDEVSEALSSEFLIDFEEAERVKRSLGQAGPLQAVDLFGKPLLIQAEAAMKTVLEPVAGMAREIAASILALNGGDPPQAVLLVGGGSLSPGLDRMLAEALGLPAARVGHRPPSLQKIFASVPDGLREVWAVTPLGIAAMALEGRGLPFCDFSINGEALQLPNLNQTFTVFDALAAAGMEVRQLYGRPGMALTYTFNGRLCAAKGEMGAAARVLRRGEAVGLDAGLAQGDALEFTRGTPGADGHSSVAEALLAAGFDPAGLEARTIAVTVNGEPKVLSQRNYRVTVNGREAALDQALCEGDQLAFEAPISIKERVRDILPAAESRRGLVVNGRPLEMPLAPRAWMNGLAVSLDEFLIDGADIHTEAHPTACTLAQLLGQLRLDAEKLKSGGLVMQVDGQTAALDTLLPEGAHVELQFNG